MKLYDVIVADETTSHLVLEYCAGGDLLTFCLATGNLSEPQARHFYRDLLDALDYIHRKVFFFFFCLVLFAFCCVCAQCRIIFTATNGCCLFVFFVFVVFAPCGGSCAPPRCCLFCSFLLLRG